MFYEVLFKIMRFELYVINMCEKNKCLFIFQVNQSLILEVEKSIKVTEDIIINLKKERKELSDLWALWNFKITQVKPIKQQCQIFKEQLRIVSKKLERNVSKCIKYF